MPCQTFGRRLGEQRWVRRFTQANRTGAFLRVIENGEIGAGDTVDIVRTPVHGVTIAEWFAARFGVAHGEALPDPDTLEKLARRLLDAHAVGEISLGADMLRRSEQAAGRAAAD